MCEHAEKPQEPLSEILTDKQVVMLNTWIHTERLAFEGYDDTLLNGVRIFAVDPKTDERWEIDFVRRKE